NRLKAEGRLLNGLPRADDTTRYESGVGKTNFRLKHISGGELKEGLERLFQKLYAPEAFSARLLGNLSRFKNVTFRPERLRASYLPIFWRLICYYWSRGEVARRFFWGSLWRALRHAPRITGQMVIYLGMYVHFLEIHRRALSWDPWTKAEEKPKTFDENPTEAIALPPAHRLHSWRKNGTLSDVEAVVARKAA
ncbi:MAG TPA: DUF4070 domain-containing protein, partial [Gemmataceae bacterium]|nr:DUF4070 domain-containing protein [Gemmataceae bacterium]